MKYTADTYRLAAEMYQREMGVPDDADMAVLAALRIAARVAQPGFLEDALRDRYDTPLSIAEDVRTSLTSTEDAT